MPDETSPVLPATVTNLPVNNVPVNVVGVCGALAGTSTRRVLQIALDGARIGGAHIQILDLAELHLPFAGSNWSAAKYPDVERFNGAIQASDALIWATPEYHGSFTGALKNALDLGSFTEYEGKMIGLIGVAGGSMGAAGALGHLRTVARQLHAWVLPQQVSVASSGQAFSPEGALLDQDLEKRLVEMGRAVAKYARLHATLGLE